jgi:nitrite reductase/ring-hydroxylating ferredoxin subunit
MQKVEDIIRPLIKGEILLVPCIIRDYPVWWGKSAIIPVINHPHSDRENGQKEIHYHIDERFVDFDENYFKEREDYYIDYSDKRIILKKHEKIERFALPVFNEDIITVTENTAIAKSKIKHKCIYKGKCPHRGYDLSQVKPVDGIIKCPLHSLEFDAESGKLLTKFNN